MPSITIKNLPADLHRRLRERAAQHQRSLNSELIACIRNSVMVTPVDTDELLAHVRALRAQVSGRLTDHALRGFRDRGRP